MEIKHNFTQILIAFDQFLNTLLCSIFEPFSKQWADETFSAHCYRSKDKNFVWKAMYHLVNLLFFWQSADHCYLAYVSEKERKHLPKELQEE